MLASVESIAGKVRELRGARRAAWIGLVLLAIWIAGWLAAAFLFGRMLTYRFVSPRELATVDETASFTVSGDQLVISEVNGWRLRISHVDLATGATRGPTETDLEQLTRQGLAAARQQQPQQQQQQTAPDPKGGLDYGPQQQTLGGSAYGPPAPTRSGVSVSADGKSVAWIIGNALFTVRPRLAATTASRALASIPVTPPSNVSVTRIRGTRCEPVLGTTVLAIACERALELRDPRTGQLVRSLNGEHRVLRTPQGAVFAGVSNYVTAIDLTGETGERRAVLARPRAVLVMPSGLRAIATDDGNVQVEVSRAESWPIRAPGTVDALAVFSPREIVVGGTFRGFHVLSMDGLSARQLYDDVVGTRFLHALDGDRIAYAAANRVAIASWTTARTFATRGYVFLFMAALPFVLAAGLLVVGLTWRPRPQEAAATTPAGAEPPFHLPLPDPPPGLVKACLDGECVLYAGAGLSAQAGYPSWQPFVADLLEWSRQTERIDADFAASLKTALSAGLADSVADSLLSVVGRPEILARTQEAFGRDRPVTAAHRALKRIPFNAALTTNFDTLLERTYPDAADKVLTPRHAERIAELLGKREFFIAKLYGSLSHPQTLVVAPADYAEAVSRNQPFSQALEGIFVSRTLLFLGASLEGIEAYLSGLTFRGQMTRPHYALVAVTDAGWRAKAEPLRRRYGIEVLPYTPDAGFSQVQEFLARLESHLGRAPDVHTGKAAAGEGLRRLRLENIGPFPELDLELQPDWNVILGDNGVGKSSILRAIAACFCGRDATAYAGRLIRSGEPSGSIVLETTRNTYRMQLRRTDTGAELNVVPSRPLEAEGILALGFPPLRAVSWNRPKGPTGEGRRRATVEDLMPIVVGEPDPRLDRLKQWIVNLDYQINRARSEGADNRYERLLTRFFEIVDEVTPGMSIRFGRVHPSTSEVTVVTADGEIPIEMVSQGSVSLMGWIGVLLQRLYEIYGDDEDPTHRYALVLIDEIDAHMHPEWQQSVVQHMNRIFRHVQYVATTHSPLVVGGMEGRQVLRFARQRDGSVLQLPVTDEMLVGRADQILTGRLFGMKTTLDQQTQGMMDRYKALLGQSRRSPDDEEEFQRLHRELKFKIPIAEETAAERKAIALVEAVVNDQLSALLPQAREQVVEKARALLDEVQVSESRPQ